MNLFFIYKKVKDLSGIDYISMSKKLFLDRNTVKRWEQNEKIPFNYYNDFFLLAKKINDNSLNKMFDDIKHLDCKERKNDEFFTTPEISKHCFIKLKKILKQLNINYNNYIFIEPSAGSGSFYNLLPESKRIGIDLDNTFNNEYIKKNFLDYNPKKGKYIVFGNPPFGLRGNLALRFINHANKFADIVAFILPPLFNSDGKGSPMNRIKNYQLAYSENLPLDSFIFPNGKKVNVATCFQIWTKINKEKIKIKNKQTARQYIKIYSLSDGGTSSTTRNKKMLYKCDFYLPSTCFSGMKLYNSFEELPYKRGYGIVVLKNKEAIINILKTTNWKKESFLSTNSALNLRSGLIENVIIRFGFMD